MGKCIFNHRLSDEKLSWVRVKSDKHKAMCCVCNKVIDIDGMGESALKFHMKGKKHKRNTSATSSPTLKMSLLLQKKVTWVVTKGQNLVLLVHKQVMMNFLFPHLPWQQIVNQQSSLQRDVKDVTFWQIFGKNMVCYLLKLCGHCKRYQLIIPTRQTRKWEKFFKPCFQIVRLQQSLPVRKRKLPIFISLAWQSTLKNHWWMKSKVLSWFYLLKV